MEGEEEEGGRVEFGEPESRVGNRCCIPLYSSSPPSPAGTLLQKYWYTYTYGYRVADRQRGGVALCLLTCLAGVTTKEDLWEAVTADGTLSQTSQGVKREHSLGCQFITKFSQSKILDLGLCIYYYLRSGCQSPPLPRAKGRGAVRLVRVRQPAFLCPFCLHGMCVSVCI